MISSQRKQSIVYFFNFEMREHNRDLRLLTEYEKLPVDVLQLRTRETEDEIHYLYRIKICVSVILGLEGLWYAFISHPLLQWSTMLMAWLMLFLVYVVLSNKIKKEETTLVILNVAEQSKRET